MEELVFGPFTINANRRILLRNGVTIPLGSRAIDVLIHLATHAGELRTNSQIVKHVWPDTFVEEANLRVHISALRKALGDTQREPQFIANIPGRGYTFVAQVRKEQRAAVELAAVPGAPDRAISRIFGREETISSIETQISKARLLTVVGPGGIGKSTVARAVTSPDRCLSEIVWIDLSEVANPRLVPTVVASAIGVLARSENIVLDISAHFGSRDVLMVLDSCEHVVESVASFVEEVLSRAPGLRILATSREPLRATGERVNRLPPLDTPLSAPTARDALRFPAVQLFVDRADACLGGYKLSDADAPHVAEICARLDGIALAIELAAGRLETIGIAALATSLTDCFRVLTRGRRTALPRHQTLRATLDWSYTILSQPERAAVCELSVFPGWFTNDAASSVLADRDTEELIAALVAKSLVVADASQGETRYRLLGTTRLYAWQKLGEAGETTATMTRLAEYLTAMFERGEHELYSSPLSDWTRDYAQQVGSMRAVLDWAFGRAGDPSLGVRLTVSALPLFFRLSLLDECLVAVTHAISYLENRPGLDERSRMKLYAALGWPQMRATAAPEHGVAAWTTALAIAEEIGDVDHQLRAIWALWVDAINRAEPRLGFEYADRFSILAASSSDRTDAIVGKRMRGATLHWLGRQAETRDQLRQMLQEYEALPERHHSIRFQFDQRVTGRIILARALWLLGEEDNALREVEEAVQYAINIRHDLSLCNVLAEAACPLSLLSGDEALATRYIGMLKDHTKALSLDVWNCYADCFKAELHLRAGRTDACLQQLMPSMAILRKSGFLLFMTFFQSIAAQALAAQGRHTDALEMAESAIAHCESSGERWCLAELYRVRATVLLRQGTTDSMFSAEDSLRLALEIARKDGSVAWEQRVNKEISAVPLFDEQPISASR
ncbi:ATP-binding protein [Rhizobium giardinii]|uniref:Putative ATPase/DNA-binding winged helix-turn-helix (WHTH) protein n=1 Tax=Rhizobium giardinii TaxID=56731 RepID=A0A7W8UDE1_9HYPH|nr:winged helix-turn-helix domain-containing protein [Rhizobium giardinii]MBB5537203.1 putative ATPase/DNA-binding winged helix-turn-helix (wHTH) protein [Rhizobium giardinii]